MVALLSPWGAQTAAHQPAATMGALRLGNNLTKRMGFAIADYHCSATQPTIQPINPPPVKAALFSSEAASTSAKLHTVLVQLFKLNTS